MKTCFKCDRTLPLEEFYRHPRMSDGHLGKCKECTRTDVALNQLVRNEYYRAYDKARSNRPDRVSDRKSRNRSTIARLWKRVWLEDYRERFPEKRLAHSGVNNAIRDGRLERQPCEACGARAHAHHDDYSRPLDVRWLCPRHHSEHHRQLRER